MTVGHVDDVAALVDRCMDKWMAEPTLNANAAVAAWHRRAQRCGFKFLVTQLMGYLSGGPQVYTGRDMAASHKHLGITDDEWVAFMRVVSKLSAPAMLLKPSNMTRNFTDESSSSSHSAGILEKGGAGGSSSSRSGP